MPHKRNHGNRRINRVINQFITNVPEIRVPTPEDIEESIVVLKQVIADIDFYYSFVDEDWQEVISVDVARDLLNRYLNEYLLAGINPGIPNENAGDREDCGECVDFNPDDPQPPGENQYTPGDPNKDGHIDILDVILLINQILTYQDSTLLGGGNGRTVCFLPEQLINMGDGSKKPIIDIKENDFVKVFDTETNQVKISKVNKIVSLEHDDVYELHLSNDKILKPTGNHPFWTKDKDWTTIDGHSPNHAGGNGILGIGDFVYDIENGWVEVTNIISVPGNHLTYNLIDMETGTVIADDIVTHNTGGSDGGGAGGEGVGPGFIGIGPPVGPGQATGTECGFGLPPCTGGDVCIQGYCVDIEGGTVHGCTDETQYNYDPSANTPCTQHTHPEECGQMGEIGANCCCMPTTGLPTEGNITITYNSDYTEILYTSDTDIAAFEFGHSCNIDALNVVGGDAFDLGWTVASSQIALVAFSITGDVIPAGTGTLVRFDSTTASSIAETEGSCIGNWVISSLTATPIAVTWNAGCVGEIEFCPDSGEVFQSCNNGGDTYCTSDGDANELCPVYDALMVCNGSCESDEDGDGVCDDLDDCVGYFDECGVCNGDNSTCSGCTDGPGVELPPVILNPYFQGIYTDPAITTEEFFHEWPHLTPDMFDSSTIFDSSEIVPLLVYDVSPEFSHRMGTKSTADAYCRYMHNDGVEAISWETMSINSFAQQSQIEVNRPNIYDSGDCVCPESLPHGHPCTDVQGSDYCSEVYNFGTGPIDDFRYYCPSECVYLPTSNSSTFYCSNADNCPYNFIMGDHSYNTSGWSLYPIEHLEDFHTDDPGYQSYKDVIYNLQCGTPLCAEGCTDSGFDNNQSSDTYGIEITTINRYCFELGYENAISWEVGEELFSSTAYYCRGGGYDCIDKPGGGWFFNNDPYDSDNLSFKYSIKNLQCGVELSACNYDSSATVDDGSCDYSCHNPIDEDAFPGIPGSGDINGDGNFDVLDVVGAVQHVLGNNSLDYYQFQSIDMNLDGTIDVLDIVQSVTLILDGGGCTNPDALNYDPDAIEDDGSCEYNTRPTAILDISVTNENGETVQSFNNSSGEEFGIYGGEGFNLVLNASNSYDNNEGQGISYCFVFNVQSGYFPIESTWCPPTGNSSDFTFNESAPPQISIAITEDMMGEAFVAFTTVDFQLLVVDSLGEYSFLSPSNTLFVLNPAEQDYGCTDITACNYNPDASIDDGSCEFDLGCSCEFAGVEGTLIQFENLNYCHPPNGEEIELRGQGIAGEIPESICGIESIREISLGNNNLSGPIPRCLGEMLFLQELYLGGNQLTGPIPETFGNKYLLYENLEGAPLGCRNYQEFLETPPSLSVGSGGSRNDHCPWSALELNNNQLSGQIPESFCNLIIRYEYYVDEDGFIEVHNCSGDPVIQEDGSFTESWAEPSFGLVCQEHIDDGLDLINNHFCPSDFPSCFHYGEESISQTYLYAETGGRPPNCCETGDSGEYSYVCTWDNNYVVTTNLCATAADIPYLPPGQCSGVGGTASCVCGLNGTCQYTCQEGYEYDIGAGECIEIIPEVGDGIYGCLDSGATNYDSEAIFSQYNQYSYYGSICHYDSNHPKYTPPEVLYNIIDTQTCFGCFDDGTGQGFYDSIGWSLIYDEGNPGNYPQLEGCNYNTDWEDTESWAVVEIASGNPQGFDDLIYIDDGSCTYPELYCLAYGGSDILCDLTDPTDPESVTLDYFCPDDVPDDFILYDESTGVDIYGCTDDSACNFNSVATYDDGSCYYELNDNLHPDLNIPLTYRNCNGICYNDEDGDNVCDEEEIQGCTDETKCNYNPDATNDDGTCESPTVHNCYADDDVDGYFEVDLGPFEFCSEVDNHLGLPQNCQGYDESYSNDLNPKYGCTESAACNFDSFADINCTNPSEQLNDGMECDPCYYPGTPDGVHDDWCDCEGNVLDDCGICGGDNESQIECPDGELVCDGFECFSDDVFGLCGADLNNDLTVDILDIVYLIGVINGDFQIPECAISGCTDPDACNYDEFAGNDDGSCTYPTDDGEGGWEGVQNVPAEEASTIYNCDGVCIAGYGCDGVCGSGLEFDDCGVCDGPGFGQDPPAYFICPDGTEVCSQDECILGVAGYLIVTDGTVADIRGATETDSISGDTWESDNNYWTFWNAGSCENFESFNPTQSRPFFPQCSYDYGFEIGCGPNLYDITDGLAIHDLGEYANPQVPYNGIGYDNFMNVNYPKMCAFFFGQNNTDVDGNVLAPAEYQNQTIVTSNNLSEALLPSPLNQYDDSFAVFCEYYDSDPFDSYIDIGFTSYPSGTPYSDACNAQWMRNYNGEYLPPDYVGDPVNNLNPYAENAPKAPNESTFSYPPFVTSFDPDLDSNPIFGPGYEAGSSPISPGYGPGNSFIGYDGTNNGSQFPIVEDYGWDWEPCEGGIGNPIGPQRSFQVIKCIETGIRGCTDPDAYNFKIEATFDDGSCAYYIPKCVGLEFELKTIAGGEDDFWLTPEEYLATYNLYSGNPDSENVDSMLEYDCNYDFLSEAFVEQLAPISRVRAKCQVYGNNPPDGEEQYKYAKLGCSGGPNNWDNYSDESIGMTPSSGDIFWGTGVQACERDFFSYKININESPECNYFNLDYEQYFYDFHENSDGLVTEALHFYYGCDLGSSGKINPGVSLFENQINKMIHINGFSTTIQYPFDTPGSSPYYHIVSHDISVNDGDGYSIGFIPGGQDGEACWDTNDLPAGMPMGGDIGLENLPLVAGFGGHVGHPTVSQLPPNSQIYLDNNNDNVYYLWDESSYDDSQALMDGDIDFPAYNATGFNLYGGGGSGPADKPDESATMWCKQMGYPGGFESYEQSDETQEHVVWWISACEDITWDHPEHGHGDNFPYPADNAWHGEYDGGEGSDWRFHTCDWYAIDPIDRCGTWGDLTWEIADGGSGLSANEACCVCGGGNVDASSPTGDTGGYWSITSSGNEFPIMKNLKCVGGASGPAYMNYSFDDYGWNSWHGLEWSWESRTRSEVLNSAELTAEQYCRQVGCSWRGQSFVPSGDVPQGWTKMSQVEVDWETDSSGNILYGNNQNNTIGLRYPYLTVGDWLSGADFGSMEEKYYQYEDPYNFEITPWVFNNSPSAQINRIVCDYPFTSLGTGQLGEPIFSQNSQGYINVPSDDDLFLWVNIPTFDGTPESLKIYDTISITGINVSGVPTFDEYNTLGTFLIAEIPISDLVNGCTNPQAINYNPVSEIDDGSCEFYTFDIGTPNLTWEIDGEVDGTVTENQTVTFKIFNLPEDPSDSADYSINYDFYVNSEHGFNLISSYEDSGFTYENPVYGLEIQIPELFNYMDESFYVSTGINQGGALTSFPDNDLLDVDIIDNMGEYNYNTIGIQPCSLTGGFPNIYPTSCSEGSNPGTYYYSCVGGEIQDIQDNCNNNVGGVLPASVSFGSFCLMNTSAECDCDPTEIEEIPEELEDLCYISQITPTPDFPYGQSHVGYITFNSTASDGSGEFLVGKKFPIGDVNQQSLAGTAEKFTFKLFTGVEPIEFATYAGGHDITLTYSNLNYDETGSAIDLIVGGRITVTRNGIGDDLTFYLPNESNQLNVPIFNLIDPVGACTDSNATNYYCNVWASLNATNDFDLPDCSLSGGIIGDEHYFLYEDGSCVYPPQEMTFNIIDGDVEILSSDPPEGIEAIAGVEDYQTASINFKYNLSTQYQWVYNGLDDSLYDPSEGCGVDPFSGQCYGRTYPLQPCYDETNVDSIEPYFQGFNNLDEIASELMNDCYSAMQEIQMDDWVLSGPMGNPLDSNLWEGEQLPEIVNVTAVASPLVSPHLPAWYAIFDPPVYRLELSLPYINPDIYPDPVELEITHTPTMLGSDLTTITQERKFRLQVDTIGVSGCPDPIACNFNSSPNVIDDGSCLLPDLQCYRDYNDDGEGWYLTPLQYLVCPENSFDSNPNPFIEESVGYGCPDGYVDNYDEMDAPFPDTEQPGCTDPTAGNYDSYIIFDCLGNDIGSVGYEQLDGWNSCCDYLNFCDNDTACNFGDSQHSCIFADEVDGVMCYDDSDGDGSGYIHLVHGDSTGPIYSCPINYTWSGESETNLQETFNNTGVTYGCLEFYALSPDDGGGDWDTDPYFGVGSGFISFRGIEDIGYDLNGLYTGFSDFTRWGINRGLDFNGINTGQELPSSIGKFYAVPGSGFERDLFSDSEKNTLGFGSDGLGSLPITQDVFPAELFGCPFGLVAPSSDDGIDRNCSPLGFEGRTQISNLGNIIKIIGPDLSNQSHLTQELMIIVENSLTNPELECNQLGSFELYDNAGTPGAGDLGYDDTYDGILYPGYFPSHELENGSLGCVKVLRGAFGTVPMEISIGDFFEIGKAGVETPEIGLYDEESIRVQDNRMFFRCEQTCLVHEDDTSCNESSLTPEGFIGYSDGYCKTSTSEQSCNQSFPIDWQYEPYDIVDNPSECCALRYGGVSDNYQAIRCGVMDNGEDDLSNNNFNQITGWACYEDAKWLTIEGDNSSFVENESECCARFGYDISTLDTEQIQMIDVPDVYLGDAYEGDISPYKSRVLQCAPTNTGCPAPQAYNFDPYSTEEIAIADCEYPETYDIENYTDSFGNYIPVWPGCMDISAVNLDRKANLHIPALCMYLDDSTDEISFPHKMSHRVPIGQDEFADSTTVNKKDFIPQLWDGQKYPWTNLINLPIVEDYLHTEYNFYIDDGAVIELTDSDSIIYSGEVTQAIINEDWMRNIVDNVPRSREQDLGTSNGAGGVLQRTNALCTGIADIGNGDEDLPLQIARRQWCMDDWNNCYRKDYSDLHDTECVEDWCENAYLRGDLEEGNIFNCEDKLTGCIEYYDRYILELDDIDDGDGLIRGPYDCGGQNYFYTTPLTNICEGLPSSLNTLARGIKQWIPINSNIQYTHGVEGGSGTTANAFIDDYKYNELTGFSPYSEDEDKQWTAKRFIIDQDINYWFYDEWVWSMRECCGLSSGIEFRGRPADDDVRKFGGISGYNSFCNQHVSDKGNFYTQIQDESGDSDPNTIKTRPAFNYLEYGFRYSIPGCTFATAHCNANLDYANVDDGSCQFHNIFYRDSDGDGYLDVDDFGDPITCSPFDSCPGEPRPVALNPVTGLYYPCLMKVESLGLEESVESGFVLPEEDSTLVYGCTDPTATGISGTDDGNGLQIGAYNYLANWDDGSCMYSGCFPIETVLGIEPINSFCLMNPNSYICPNAGGFYENNPFESYNPDSYYRFDEGFTSAPLGVEFPPGSNVITYIEDDGSCNYIDASNIVEFDLKIDIYWNFISIPFYLANLETGEQDTSIDNFFNQLWSSLSEYAGPHCSKSIQTSVWDPVYGFQPEVAVWNADLQDWIGPLSTNPEGIIPGRTYELNQANPYDNFSVVCNQEYVDKQTECRSNLTSDLCNSTPGCLYGIDLETGNPACNGGYGCMEVDEIRSICANPNGCEVNIYDEDNPDTEEDESENIIDSYIMDYNAFYHGLPEYGGCFNTIKYVCSSMASLPLAGGISTEPWQEAYGSMMVPLEFVFDTKTECDLNPYNICTSEGDGITTPTCVEVEPSPVENIRRSSDVTFRGYRSQLLYESCSEFQEKRKWECDTIPGSRWGVYEDSIDNVRGLKLTYYECNAIQQQLAEQIQDPVEGFTNEDNLAIWYGEPVYSFSTEWPYNITDTPNPFFDPLPCSLYNDNPFSCDDDTVAPDCEYRFASEAAPYGMPQGCYHVSTCGDGYLPCTGFCTQQGLQGELRPRSSGYRPDGVYVENNNLSLTYGECKDSLGSELETVIPNLMEVIDEQGFLDTNEELLGYSFYTYQEGNEYLNLTDELDGIINLGNFYDPTNADQICDCEVIHSDSQNQYDYEDILLECFQNLIEQYGGTPPQSCLSNFVFIGTSGQSLVANAPIGFVEPPTGPNDCWDGYNTYFDSEDECPIEEVEGCPNPAASNYDPDVNSDDGSCEYEIPECTTDVCVDVELIEGDIPDLGNGSVGDEIYFPEPFGQGQGGTCSESGLSCSPQTCWGTFGNICDKWYSETAVSAFDPDDDSYFYCGDCIPNTTTGLGSSAILSQTNESGIQTFTVYHNGCVGSVAGGIFDTTEASVIYEDDYFQVIVSPSIYEGGEACVTGVTDTADSGDAGFTISEGETQILGFSFTGAGIPSGTGTLLVLEGETISFDVTCLNSFIISTYNGVPLSVETGTCSGSQDVCFTLEDNGNGTWNLNYDSTEDIAGFQFTYSLEAGELIAGILPTDISEILFNLYPPEYSQGENPFNSIITTDCLTGFEFQAPDGVGGIIEVDYTYMPDVTPDETYNVVGCTDPEAFNWNPIATIDDGSCQSQGCQDYQPGPHPDVHGNCYDGNPCDDVDYFCCGGENGYLPINYDPEVIINNQSCIYYELGCPAGTQVCLSVNPATGELGYTSTENISSFQITHDGCVTDARGGVTEENEFVINVTDSLVIATTTSSDFIPTSTENVTLLELIGTTVDECFEVNEGGYLYAVYDYEQGNEYLNWYDTFTSELLFYLGNNEIDLDGDGYPEYALFTYQVGFDYLNLSSELNNIIISGNNWDTSADNYGVDNDGFDYAVFSYVDTLHEYIDFNTVLTSYLELNNPYTYGNGYSNLDHWLNYQLGFEDNSNVTLASKFPELLNRELTNTYDISNHLHTDWAIDHYYLVPRYEFLYDFLLGTSSDESSLILNPDGYSFYETYEGNETQDNETYNRYENLADYLSVLINNDTITIDELANIYFNRLFGVTNYFDESWAVAFYGFDAQWAIDTYGASAEFLEFQDLDDEQFFNRTFISRLDTFLEQGDPTYDDDSPLIYSTHTYCTNEQVENQETGPYGELCTSTDIIYEAGSSFENLDLWLLATAQGIDSDSEGDDTIENKLPLFLSEYGGIGDVVPIPITAFVWNFVGYLFSEPADAMNFMMSSFSNPNLPDGTMIQGPDDESGSISTITYNSIAQAWDGSLQLQPGRGYRVYFKEDGVFQWASELALDNVCSDEDALNYYDWCSSDIINCDEEANQSCCIGEGLAFDIDDVRFCPDSTALNYNPNLDEFLANGCSYFGECIYESSDSHQLFGYYTNELKFLLDFVELNELLSADFLREEFDLDRERDRFDDSFLLNEALLQYLFDATCPTDGELGEGDPTQTYCLIKWSGGRVSEINIDASNVQLGGIIANGNLKIPYSIGALTNYTNLIIKNNENLSSLPSSIKNRIEIYGDNGIINNVLLENNRFEYDYLNSDDLQFLSYGVDTISFNNNITPLGFIPTTLLQPENNIRNLYLSGCGLTEIPTGIQYVGDNTGFGLQNLDLSNNNFVDGYHLPVEFWELTKLIWTTDSGNECPDGYSDILGDGKYCRRGGYNFNLSNNTGLTWVNDGEYVRDNVGIYQLQLDNNGYGSDTDGLITGTTLEYLPWSLTILSIQDNNLSEIDIEIVPPCPLASFEMTLCNVLRLDGNNISSIGELVNMYGSYHSISVTGNVQISRLDFSYNDENIVSSIDDFSTSAFMRLGLKKLNITSLDEPWGNGSSQGWTACGSGNCYSDVTAGRGEFYWKSSGGSGEPDPLVHQSGNYVDIGGNPFHCQCANPSQSGANCPDSGVRSNIYGIGSGHLQGWGCPEGHGSNSESLYTYNNYYDPGTEQIRICPIDSPGWCGDGCSDETASNYEELATLDCIGTPLDDCGDNCNLDCCEYGE